MFDPRSVTSAPSTVKVFDWLGHRLPRSNFFGSTAIRDCSFRHRDCRCFRCRRYARSEGHKSNEIAIIDGQFANLITVDQCTAGSRRKIDRNRIRLNSDYFVDPTCRKRHVNRPPLAYIQSYVRFNRFLEIRSLNGDDVRSNRQIRSRELAAIIVVQRSNRTPRRAASSIVTVAPATTAPANPERCQRSYPLRSARTQQPRSTIKRP